jgi:divalent metal cation (Fe/Co/Zn/Cd) transporter
MRYLIGGLILITVGVSAILELTNSSLSSGEYLAITLLVIGLILILGSVYHALSGRKRVNSRILKAPTEKKPAPTPTS